MSAVLVDASIARHVPALPPSDPVYVYRLYLAAIARRDIAGGGNAVLRRHGHAMTGFTLGGTDPSDGAVFASASGWFASIPIEAGRFRAVNP